MQRIAYSLLIAFAVSVGASVAADEPAKKPKPPGRVLRLEPGFDGALALAFQVNLQFGGYVQQEGNAAGWHFRRIAVVGEKSGVLKGKRGLPITTDAEDDAFKELGDKTMTLSATGYRLPAGIPAAEKANLEAIARAAEVVDARSVDGPFTAALALAPGYDDAVAATMRILLTARGLKVVVVAPRKGAVKGMHGLGMHAQLAYSDSLDLPEGAIVVCPGRDWSAKPKKADADVRLHWIMSQHKAGATLVTFGSDTAAMRDIPAFEGGVFADAGLDLKPTLTPLAQPEKENRATWTADRLLTASDVRCIPNVWRLLPVPNRPDHEVGIVGDLYWAAAHGEAERAVWGMPDGTPGGDRTHLICTVEPMAGVLRNNFMSRSPDIGHLLQISSIRFDTPRSHNGKIMMGVMDRNWKFAHGINGDLVHWAGGNRVVLFIPVRHSDGADPKDGNAYFISPYNGQTISVMEFQPGEMIHYGWFGGAPEQFHRRVLFDLYPYCKDMKPGVTQPIFKFDVYDGGRWKVCIRFDGRAGIPEEAVESDFDLVFTDRSKGAKPYSVALSTDNVASYSVYNPGSGGSQVILRMDPYSRGTGKRMPAVDRETYKPNVALASLAEAEGD